MKKLLWSLVLIVIVSFAVWSKDPIYDTVNFIIGGTIPGTKLSIGFWSMLGIAGAILLVIRSGLQSLKLQMLAHTATEIKAGEAKKEFETSHNFEFDRSKRSVIAARN